MTLSFEEKSVVGLLLESDIESSYRTQASPWPFGWTMGKSLDGDLGELDPDPAPSSQIV